MKWLRPCLAGLLALTLLPAPADAARAPARKASGAAASACCSVPAGAPVQIELVDAISTKTHNEGDTFAIRLAQPLVINGQIVLPAGTTGVGEVVEAAKPGFGGKGGELVLGARELTYRDKRIPLQGLQLAAAGKGRANEAQAAGVAGLVAAPLGFVGLAVKGGNVEIAAGTVATAKIAEPLVLSSLGAAPRGAASAAAPTEPSVSPASLGLQSPAPGKGQVVFFRKKSLLGTGQWFNVRENGQALGKLTNGAYFVVPLDPGRHTFTASTEPEFKDNLQLQIDPGETYFVEGALAKGVVIGTANLVPSNAEAFQGALRDLKPTSEAGG